MNEGYIYVEKWKDNSFVDFWFVTGDEQLYMFSTRYSKNLYEYFKYKRTVKHILSRHKWNRNTRIDHLIQSRIPYEIKNLRRRGVKI